MLAFLKSDRTKSVEYWEGWQAVELHKQCSYTDSKQRKEWAKGFADGVIEMRGSKSWYKSRTMIVGLSMLFVGVSLIGYGIYSGGTTIIGAGTGVTATSVLMAALRMISNTNITLGPGGGGGQYTPPPS
jgi:hypothetical protein